MSMARLTFPSRLELNRPEGSSSAAPLANVILTTLLYVSPVQTMPPWDQTGVPGFVGFTHFHSSTISGSAWWMMSKSGRDRKSTRLNSSHRCISYAVFCLKKKNEEERMKHNSDDE